MTIGAAASWEGIAAVRAMPRQLNEAAPIDQGDEDRRRSLPGNRHRVEHAAERGEQDQHHQRRHDRVADAAGDEDPGRHRRAAAALEAAVLAGDHQRHRQALHRRRDHREGDDRRHVVGRRLDPAVDVDRLAAEDGGEDQQQHDREHHREEDRRRVAPEGLLVVAELVPDRPGPHSGGLRGGRSAPGRRPRASAASLPGLSSSSPSASAAPVSSCRVSTGVRVSTTTSRPSAAVADRRSPGCRVRRGPRGCRGRRSRRRR